MTKSLDNRLTDIRENPNSDAFIIAYAADPDMSWGVATLPTEIQPGPLATDLHPMRQTNAMAQLTRGDGSPGKSLRWQ